MRPVFTPQSAGHGTGCRGDLYTKQMKPALVDQLSSRGERKTKVGEVILER